MLLPSILKRIERNSLPAKTPQGLKELMQAFAEHIPFENLDVHLGRRIRLAPEAIEEKILVHRRGGYCYEVNGLLYRLLQAWGVETRLMGARTILGYSELRPVTHMILKGTLEGQDFLCDLGFSGLSPVEPIAMDASEASRYHRLIQTEENHYILQGKDEQDQWISLYSFEDRPLQEVDFEPANYFNNVSPDSICTQQVMCAIQKGDSLIRLVQNHLKIRRGREEEKETLEDSRHLDFILKTHFGIHLKPWETKLLFQRCSTG